MTRHTTQDLEISSDDFDEEWFFFNKCLKKFLEHENFVLCKLLFSMYYTPTTLLIIV